MIRGSYSLFSVGSNSNPFFPPKRSLVRSFTIDETKAEHTGPKFAQKPKLPTIIAGSPPDEQNEGTKII